MKHPPRWIVVIVLSVLPLATAAAGQSGSPAARSTRASVETPGSLSGTAADSSGARLPGVTVQLVRKIADVRPLDTTTTDADGVFRFPSVRPGELHRAVRPAGVFADTVSGPYRRRRARDSRGHARGRRVERERTSPGVGDRAGGRLGDTVGEVVERSAERPADRLEKLYARHRRGGRRQRTAAGSDRQGAEHRDYTRRARRRRIAVAQPQRERCETDEQRASHQRRRCDQHAQRQRRTGEQRRHSARGPRRSASADGATLRGARAKRRRQRGPRHPVGRQSLLRLGRLLLSAREAQRERVLPEPRRRGEAGVPPQRHDRHAGRPDPARPHVLLRGGSAPGLQVRLCVECQRRDRVAHRADRSAQRGDDRGRRERMDADRPAGQSPVRRELHERPARFSRGATGRADRDVLRRSGAARVPRPDARRHSSGGAQHPEHEARWEAADSLSDLGSAGAARHRDVRT